MKCPDSKPNLSHVCIYPNLLKAITSIHRLCEFVKDVSINPGSPRHTNSKIGCFSIYWKLDSFVCDVTHFVCVCIKINKRLFEPFCVWISVTESVLALRTCQVLCGSFYAPYVNFHSFIL